MRQLAGMLTERDRVSIVVYAGAAGLVLEPTNDERRIKDALDQLDELRAFGCDEVVTGIGPVGNTFLISAIAILAALFIISAVSGIKRGIRLLSNINMVLAGLLAVFVFMIKEPARGAAEVVRTSAAPVDKPMRKIFAVRTFWWLTLAGLAYNFASYACNSFMVPMLQRYFGLGLQQAAMATGVIVGLTGLVGLTLGGWVADKVHQRWATGRLMFGAISMLIAALATGYALLQEEIEISLFIKRQVRFIRNRINMRWKFFRIFRRVI